MNPLDTSPLSTNSIRNVDNEDVTVENAPIKLAQLEEALLGPGSMNRIVAETRQRKAEQAAQLAAQQNAWKRTMESSFGIKPVKPIPPTPTAYVRLTTPNDERLTGRGQGIGISDTASGVNVPNTPPMRL